MGWRDNGLFAFEADDTDVEEGTNGHATDQSDPSDLLADITIDQSDPSRLLSEVTLDQDDSDTFPDFSDLQPEGETPDKPGDKHPELEETEKPVLTGQAEYDPTVYFRSSEDMSELDRHSVELVVTSPPYNADWAYGSHDDALDYQREYLPMLARVFQECWRVLRPAGRMAINVPTLLRGGSSGGQAILSDIDTLLNEKVGVWEPDPDVFGGEESEQYKSIKSCMDETQFVHREWVSWCKGFNTDGQAPNGSFPRPGGILLNNVHEGISIYQKPGTRDYDRMPESVIENSKIQKWEDEICDDVWNISPTNFEFQHAEEEDVPPYPEELVKRCVALWTYEDDTVLDPFLGRGTTCKVAKELNRNSVGYELRDSIRRDIKEYIGIGQMAISNW